MTTVKLSRTMIVLLAALAIASGCSDEDARLAQVTQQAAQRQAEQNQEMSHLNREIAEGTKRLVDGQADAAQHWQTMEQNIQRQHDQLEAERRQQADARQRDSLLAPILWTIGVLLVCSLPLLVCWKLLSGVAEETQEATITQFLVDEVIFPTGIASHPDEAPAILDGPQASALEDATQPPRLPR